MKHASAVLFGFVLSLGSLPVAGQTSIGGGACNSSFLNGAYAFTLTGRQVSSTATFSSALQANGTATFDGQSKVTLALTANTLQGLGTALSYSGTYTVQANCLGVINLNSGDTATLNLAIFNQGKGFAVTGNDATYTYTGTGNTQPSGCSTSTLNGPYAFNATGYSVSGSAVNGVADSTGLLQFDGQGNATMTLASASAVAGSAGTASASGTYTLSASCVGTATLTDSSGKGITATLSMTAPNGASFDLAIAQASKFILSGGGRALGQTGANSSGNCSTASLNGTYAVTLNGRAVSSAGAFTSVYQSNGTATFDGQGKASISTTTNTNQAAGKAATYSGTYTIGTTCSGSVTLSSGGTATFSLIAWNGGKNFNIAGQDNTFIYSGTGTLPPAMCGTSTLSGDYSFNANGFVLSGSNLGGVADMSGTLHFDGQGNLSASYTVTSAGTSSAVTATGNYTLSSGCTGTGTLTDSNGRGSTLNFSVSNPAGSNFDLLIANSQSISSGTARNAILNPSESIGNVASYAVNYTPPGSVFVLFGQNLAPRASQAGNVPLPTTLLNTTVTVNGEQAPLFYVDTGQIDAQMPWDIPGGTVASVVVKNGSSVSNAAAVLVPATGTPGLSVYGNNRAVVVNVDGAVNSASAPAKVDDEVVAYFTGGGPVQASGKLTTGAGSPAGLSPLSGNATLTVGGQQAKIAYIGLSPGGVGLYQVNFFVPDLNKGTYPVVLTIAGQASNNPVMTVTN